MQLTRDEIRAEALSRAQHGQSLANYPAIYEGFAAKGIAAADIKPRENVFTFNAWKAQGRSVKKGEKGVKVTTFVEMSRRDPSEAGDAAMQSFRAARSVTVFHVSQTEPTSEAEARWKANRQH